MSSSLLTDPLEADIIKYCSACDNSSATYAGRFIASPLNPEQRLEWLCRIGIMKRTDPMPPKAKRVLVCDNHFDKEHDFIHTANKTRLRRGMLPWKNLKTGTYSYHGCENPIEPPPVRPCQCACCTRPKLPSYATTVAIQTDDVECSGDLSSRTGIPRTHCRLCLQGVRATSHSLRRLFCEDTHQPADPELMEQIYVTTGLMLHWNREPAASICADCEQQTEQAYRFRLQSRSNHRRYLACLLAKQRKELYPELVYPKSSVQHGTSEEEFTETRDIEQVQLVPTDQVHIKVEPDLPPPSGGSSKKLKRNSVSPSEPCPIGQVEIKTEPGLMDCEQIATGGNLGGASGMRGQMVNFQEFKNMLTKIKAEKGS